ncbi:MAG TPA: dihydroorotate dehydrogenase-like protein [Anaerolineae bacterium]|nr:dihydroorotate dehydrogenase-like protein [Anaerolineae bacterium]
MVALTTTYLGLPLRSPIVPSASPLSRDVETLRRMADAGAGAITLHSLFEEQIEHESQLLGSVLDQTQFIYAESLDFFPMLTEFRRDEREYLKLLEAAKSAVDIPIIASLNGYSAGSWTRYARLFQEAGADAVELNIYYLPTHPRVTGAMVEDMVVEVLREVKAQVQIPVAVKLSPYFSAMAYMAKRLEEAGADGLVLFNRFYQPDLDIKALETKRTLTLSTSAELLLPLRWIAILYGQVQTSLALTTGVHTAEDVAKALMAGADVAQVCSVLLREGVSKITELLSELAILMSARGYRSVEEMKGVLSHKNTPNPEAFERANYVKLIGQ